MCRNHWPAVPAGGGGAEVVVGIEGGRETQLRNSATLEAIQGDEKTAVSCRSLGQNHYETFTNPLLAAYRRDSLITVGSIEGALTPRTEWSGFR